MISGFEVSELNFIHSVKYEPLACKSAWYVPKVVA